MQCTTRSIIIVQCTIIIVATRSLSANCVCAYSTDQCHVGAKATRAKAWLAPVPPGYRSANLVACFPALCRLRAEECRNPPRNWRVNANLTHERRLPCGGRDLSPFISTGYFARSHSTT
jgi:hypothetical protein